METVRLLLFGGGEARLSSIDGIALFTDHDIMLFLVMQAHGLVGCGGTQDAGTLPPEDSTARVTSSLSSGMAFVNCQAICS